MSTLLISDIHLSPDQPGLTRRFLDFLEAQTQGVQSIWILGDLFEAWIGDDAAGSFELGIAEALAARQRAGVDLHYLHGNRDFLLGPDFAGRAGLRLHQQPVVTELAGRRVVLCHGDQLCTDDTAYQRWRARVQDPVWQRRMLAKPVWLRRLLARALRAASSLRNRRANDELLDVNDEAVRRLLRDCQADCVIHGHTHRPGRHRIELDGSTCERIVLGDWYTQDSALLADESRIRWLCPPPA
ncbi:MAG: UDP-2,3-diacylglucosamine diphosphatase [Wenzhouxiangellaceae bacterium]